MRLLGMCGADCGNCPAYRDNARTPEERKRCSEGWRKFLGVRMDPSAIVCEGCASPNVRKSRLVNKRCPVRACALEMKTENCAFCTSYPCPTVSRPEYSPNLPRNPVNPDEPISPEDREAFIEPYRGREHLAEIRAALPPSALVRMKPHPAYRLDIVPFPQNLDLPTTEIRALGRWYLSLNNLLTHPVRSHCEQLATRKCVDRLLPLLWLFGSEGELVGDRLAVSKRCFREKAPCHHSTALRAFTLLQSMGLEARREILGSDWRLSIGFPGRPDATLLMEALRKWVHSLHSLGDRDGPRRFRRLDFTRLPVREES
jgi:hypothetical protein